MNRKQTILVIIALIVIFIAVDTCIRELIVNVRIIETLKKYKYIDIGKYRIYGKVYRLKKVAVPVKEK